MTHNGWQNIGVAALQSLSFSYLIVNRRLVGAVIAIALLATTGQSQVAAPPSFRPYSLEGTPPVETVRRLEQYLTQQGIRAEVVSDEARGRVLVSGDERAHQFASQFIAQASEPRRSEAVVDQRIDETPRLAQRAVDESSPVDKDDASLTFTNRTRQSSVQRLKHTQWRQLIDSLQTVSSQKLAWEPSPDGREVTINLPSVKGPVTIHIEPRSNNYWIDGDEQLAKLWQRAIEAIDQAGATPSGAAQMKSVGKIDRKTLVRAMDLLQGNQSQSTRTGIRWGGDLLGMQTNNAAAQNAQDEQSTAFVQLRPADANDPATEAAEGTDAPAETEPPAEGEVPAGGNIGVDGSMIGPVEIEFVEGLDAIIIRGRQPDVERVMQIIDEIEKMSQITEPTIELVLLNHVNSESMADLVTQLNTQALEARRGTVSVTALVKPNAILLIGRDESVKATIDLINRLDQPVSPMSQFKIFRLKHTSATSTQETIETFFEERGGLGTRVQVQSDYRTNSIIVYASPRDMAEVKYLIEKIDVADSEAVDEVRVFKLKNALAEELAPVLQATLRGEALGTQGGGGFQGPGQQNQGAAGQQGTTRPSMLTMTIDSEGKRLLRSGILTDVRVSADARANSLVVTAPAESMDLIRALVEQLDELPTTEAQIKVFTIVNGDASALVEMLNTLFGEQFNNQQGPALQSAAGAGESSLVPLRFSVDLRTNSIIATGSGADLGVVEAILLRLDDDDVQSRKSRVYRLQNAPALDVANAINQFLLYQRELQLAAPETVTPFQQIEREVVVVPEVVSNSLIISATPRYFEEIADIIQELDEQPPMVLIQVLIAEVALDNAEEFGVELGIQDSLLFDRSVITDGAVTPGFNFNNQQLGNSSSAASLLSREKTAGQALSNFGVGRINQDLGYGGLVLSASSESVNILIRALRESRRLDVLSRPQVMTLNNQPAFILVGQRVPIIQSVNLTTFGSSNAVNYQNVGLVLGVTPRISPEGLVVMEIDAEKSRLSEEGVPISISVNGDVLSQPIIDTTVAQTTVSARSGQTVILGGLITKSRASVTKRVPYLADIPAIGSLFRYDSEVQERTELLIIMTPYIVRKTDESDWLNQVESERMSWCLADVIEVHGDPRMSGGGIYNGGYGEVIYPDSTPTIQSNPYREPTQELPVPNQATPPTYTTPPTGSELPLPPGTDNYQGGPLDPPQNGLPIAPGPEVSGYPGESAYDSRYFAPPRNQIDGDVSPPTWAPPTDGSFDASAAAREKAREVERASFLRAQHDRQEQQPTSKRFWRR